MVVNLSPLSGTTPTFGAGKFGNALTGGALSTTTLFSGTVGTFECWVKTTTGSFKIALGNNGAGYWVGVQNGKALMGTPNSSFTTTVVINDGAWHHLAGVVDGSARSLYVDGVYQNQQTVAGTFTFGTGTTSVGTYGSDTSYLWPGIVDEVRFSNVVRYAGNFTPQTGPFAGDVNTLGLYHLESDGTDSAAVATAPSYSGNGAYAGSGTLTTTATAAAATATAFAGNGSLTAIGTPTAGGMTGYTGSGSVTASGVSASSGVATYSGSGIIGASTASAGSATPVYAGAGTLASSATPRPSTTAAFTGAGQLTAATGSSGASNPAYTGSGATVLANTVMTTTGTAYAGTGTLTASAAARGTGIAGYFGNGTMSVTATGAPPTSTPSASTIRFGARTVIAMRFGTTAINAIWLAGTEYSVGPSRIIVSVNLDGTLTSDSSLITVNPDGTLFSAAVLVNSDGTLADA